MPGIVFISHDGRERPVAGLAGQTLMQAAKGGQVPGILAECGGACSCGTCHVYVDAAWLDRLPSPGTTERHLLSLSDYVRECSRLSCCIRLTPELDGLVVRLPPSQP